MLKSKKFRIIFMVVICAFIMSTLTITAFAEKGDVAGAVEDTWQQSQGQIKRVVNNVVFPIIDTVLAIFFFIKIGTAYFDYKKSGQFEWTAPAILFASLVFMLTAPLYIWSIIGI